MENTNLPASGTLLTAVGRGQFRREAGGERLHVQLDNGQSLSVSAGRVSRQADGQYWLDVPLPELRQKLAAQPQTGQLGTQRESIVVPVVQEEISLEKRTVDAGGVRVNKLVHEREEWVEGLLRQDELNVERVPVNQFVTDTEPVQKDGDRIVVPIYEEVLVVEKRLRLKERLIITRTQHEQPVREAVTRREEEVQVERIPARPDGER